MKNSVTSSSLICALSFVVTTAVAQVVNYGAVVIMRTGDRQPALYANPGSQILSSIGANQAFENGQMYRARYMATAAGTGAESTTNIKNLDYYYDPSVVTVVTAKRPDLVASTQAFMQGLFPPTLWNTTDPKLPQYNLLETSSGNFTEYPLNGYQYPIFDIATENDDNSIYIDGSNGCMTWRDLRNDYVTSDEFSSMRDQTREFYEQVGAILQGDHVSYDQYDYASAPYIADYVNYMYTHNETIFNLINGGTLAQIDARQRLQWLADHFNFKLYGSPTIDPTANFKQISTIAGQTMAGAVVDQLQYNKESGGNSSKLTLLFTDFEPFLGFFQVSGLAGLSNDFTGMPMFGSSMAFELYSNQPLIEQVSSNDFPPDDQLMVRFLFSNGTTGGLMDYTLFQENSSMPWPVFQEHMSKVMVDNSMDWCNDCNSQLAAAFCRAQNLTAINDLFDGNSGNSNSNSDNNSMTLTPTSAGVIGAVATLIVVGLFIVFSMACFGMRFTRVLGERQDDLRGFRGSQKLASDPDLTVSKGGNRMFVSETEPKPRVGSWELKDAQEIQRPTNFRNPLAEDEDDRFHHVGASIQPVERV